MLSPCATCAIRTASSCGGKGDGKAVGYSGSMADSSVGSSCCSGDDSSSSYVGVTRSCALRYGDDVVESAAVTCVWRDGPVSICRGA